MYIFQHNNYQEVQALGRTTEQEIAHEGYVCAASGTGLLGQGLHAGTVALTGIQQEEC